MSKVVIFDPAMCCPTGVCGPSVDPELTRVASAIFLLEKKGFDIKRFNLANDPLAFAENEKVNSLLHEKGPDSLPITLLDGEVVKIGIYPTNDELANWFGVNVEELTKKPKVPLKIELKPLK
jgi:hypothetical protein